MKALTWGACPAVAQGKQFEGFFVNLAGCLFLFTIGYRRIGNNIIRIFYYYFFFYYIFFTKRSRTSSCKVTLNVKHFSMGKNKTDDEVKKKKQWRFVRVRYTVKNLLLLSQNIYKLFRLIECQ